MAYSLKSSDRTLGRGVRRIAADQLDRAIARLEDPDDLHEAVHDARKRVKKLRGLLRLLRPSLPVYAAENAYLRDAARLLSGPRDATARIEALDKLGLDPGPLAPLRRAMEEARAEAGATHDLPDRVATLRDALRTSRAHLDRWRPEKQGFAGVRGGAGKTWKRARKAMARAEDSRDPADLHEWRKRVKYHYYHARLLKRIWPAQMQPHAEAAGRLAEMLGDHRDLGALRAWLADSGAAAALSPGARHALSDAIETRMARLEHRAFRLGHKLFAPKSKALMRRWKAWWRHWGDD